MRRFGVRRFGARRSVRQWLVTLAAVGALLAGAVPQAALADAASNVGSGGIDVTSGAGVYQHVCQGCHMANGKGAVGAAAIPAFVGNAKLQSSGYPVYVVLNGLGGMPWFNGALSDVQIANVVNFIRSNFGNSYADPVKPEDVSAVRGPAPTLEH